MQEYDIFKCLKCSWDVLKRKENFTVDVETSWMGDLSSTILSNAWILSTIFHHHMANVHVADDISVHGDILSNEESMEKNSLCRTDWKCTSTFGQKYLEKSPHADVTGITMIFWICAELLNPREPNRIFTQMYAFGTEKHHGNNVILEGMKQNYANRGKSPEKSLHISCQFFPVTLSWIDDTVQNTSWAHSSVKSSFRCINKSHTGSTLP